MPERFTVLTTGRAGSNSLMQSIQAIAGVATPMTHSPISSSELLNPQLLEGFYEFYSAKTEVDLKTERELIDAFFLCNSGARFSGFKALYSQLPCLDLLARQQPLTLIVLLRRDVASTVASYMVGIDRGCWVRKGESHSSGWRYNPSRKSEVCKHVARIRVGIERFLGIPGSIVVAYEDLCSETFSNPKLNSFFSDSVQIDSPRPPVSGASYVSNWGEFKAVVAACWWQWRAQGVSFERADQWAVW